MAVFDGFLESAVRGATPLALVAIGELVAERAGVINLGLEGSIAVGAFVAFATAVVLGPAAGLAAGGAAGMALAMVFALLVIVFRAQQIIAGTAVTMLGLGLSATMHRAAVTRGEMASSITTLEPIQLPILADIPVVGHALFGQAAPTYLAYALVPLVAWLLYRSTAGVVLRAVGEHPRAVRTTGGRPELIQFVAIAACGFLGGLGGATIVVAQTGAFSDGISAGRGFIAVAIVALGRWTPGGVALGALLFGAVSAVQFLAQSLAWSVPYNLILAAPYVLTLAAMAMFRGSRVAPAALGRPLDDSA